MLFLPQLPLLPHKDFLIQESLCSAKSPQWSLFLPPSRCSTQETNPECPFALLTSLLTARKTKFVLTCTKDWLIFQHGHQRIRITLYFGKQAIPAPSLPPPTKVSSPQYSDIKETSSKAEKLNKAVKPHSCNYAQQLHRNQNFFMSVD